MKSYNVQLVWDDEAEVWMATSKDIPGSILENDSADKLIGRVMIAAPEIIELNGVEKRQDFYFHCDRHEIKSRHIANEIMKQSGISYRF